MSDTPTRRQDLLAAALKSMGHSTTILWAGPDVPLVPMTGREKFDHAVRALRETHHETTDGQTVLVFLLGPTDRDDIVQRESLHAQLDRTLDSIGTPEMFPWLACSRTEQE
jgi:hypothetical protein